MKGISHVSNIYWIENKMAESTQSNVRFFVWFIVILIGFLFLTTFYTGFKLTSTLSSIPTFVWFFIILIVIKLLFSKK